MYEKKVVGVSSLKKGDTILTDGEPCKVSEVTISKSGKHGHAKVRLIVIGLLDGKKRNLIMPGHDKVEVPLVEKKTAQVLTLSNNMANVMDTETYETFDMEIPEELQGQVVEGCQVLYWLLAGRKVMKQLK